MSEAVKKGNPNDKLRRQRELRCWTLQQAADALYELCLQDDENCVLISADQVGRWERAVKPHPKSQVKLCVLYGKNPEELGFVEAQDEPPFSPSPAQPLALSPFERPVASSVPLRSTVGLANHQAIDFLYEHPDGLPEEQLGAWLALCASHLVHLLANGWTIEAILESLRIVAQGVQVMPDDTRPLTRRQILDDLVGLGTAAFVSGIPIPSGRYISVERRIQLHKDLGESVQAGWKLFHTSGNAQVLAVSLAQIMLVQQASSQLYPNIRHVYYSGVYRLKGAALHFQGRYEEAYKAHEQAYIAALEGADTWNMAQSRGWQAYGFKAQELYPYALQACDASLRLVLQPQELESIRLRARLLAFSAENVALLGDEKEVQTRLRASEELLEHLPGQHEEFDRASWLQQSGNCALSLKQYDLARVRLQQALDEVPPQWILRTASTALSLARALTSMKEVDEALKIAKQALPLVKSLQSPVLTKAFIHYIQTELLTNFSNIEHCKAFVVNAQRQLTQA